MTKLETVLLVGACAVAGCTDLVGDGSQPAPTPSHECFPLPLQGDLPWYGANRETLTGWLDAKGCESAAFDPKAQPVALFDWDNTVLKGDIGDAMTFHFVSQGLVLQPPNQDWKKTSAYMTDQAATALRAACGTTVPAGMPLPTKTNTACADEILSMYIDNKTTGGAVAFQGHDYRRMEPTYAWTAQLMAGYTHEEIQRLTLEAAMPQLAADIDKTQTVGTRAGLAAWMRIYRQSSDLIKGARSRGYDVWIITASPADVVKALAPMVGIEPAHVIGIRQMTDAAGKLTYSFEGCGPVPDGNQSLISYIEGKRCWVNKVVFGDRSAAAIERRHDPRQVLAAGDSDTDIEFLRDSTFKLVLNRNKKELMCFAYLNEGNSWIVNPMFIEPKGRQAALYPCSTTACKTADGTSGPCRDEHGNVIADQADSVF